MLLIAHAGYSSPTLRAYAGFARYEARRHVRAGRWLAAHTPRDAVVATHDVGAIAFYSGRRDVDLSGLVSPEVVPHLNQPDYYPYLDSLFARRHVTHLAVLQEWQPVDNQLPVFEADPEPEVLDVYAWRPGVTHLVPPRVKVTEPLAMAAIEQGRYDLALGYARAMLAADDRVASSWGLLGAALDRSGHPAAADSAYRRALALFPDWAEGHFGLGAALVNQGRLAEARSQLDTLRALEPGNTGIRWLEERLGASR